MPQSNFSDGRQMRRSGNGKKGQETLMYTALEDEVFLAPESIISGLLAADFPDDAFDAPADGDYAVAASDLDLHALGV